MHKLSYNTDSFYNKWKDNIDINFLSNYGETIPHRLAEVENSKGFKIALSFIIDLKPDLSIKCNNQTILDVARDNGNWKTYQSL